MRALVSNDRERTVHEVEEPMRRPGEALVAVELAGICDTDLQLQAGYMSFAGIPGHEFVGRVLASDDPWWVGRRVVADINAGCGACASCRDERGHHCGARTVLGILGRGGAFAERLTIPERCLVAVPEAVSNDLAVFAEPLAAALHVLEDAPRPSDAIAVLGDGKLGLLIALALASEGRDVTLLGHHAHKLAIAEAGSVKVLDERSLDAARDASFDCVVDATGNAKGLARALRLARPKGTVVLKTTVTEPFSIDLSPVVINELRLVGSRCGRMDDAIGALASGRLDPTPLITARYPLARASEAVTHASARGSLKVLIQVTME